MKPRQIAVVGASERAGTIGNALMKNLLEGGFAGTVLPVNPKYDKIYGLSTSRSVSDLDDGVDLAVIATPIQSVPGVVQECVDKKVGGAIIISAGGKEAGSRGREIEAKIRTIALPAGFRLIGPNCLGVIQPEEILIRPLFPGCLWQAIWPLSPRAGASAPRSSIWPSNNRSVSAILSASVR